jgi:hypothetical protein
MGASIAKTAASANPVAPPTAAPATIPNEIPEKMARPRERGRSATIGLLASKMRDLKNQLEQAIKSVVALKPPLF